MKSRRVSDVFLSNRIIALAPDASVREASHLMAREKVGAVLVTVEDHLAGIFTERDALSRVLANKLDPDLTTLREVMTPDPISTAPDAGAIDALRLMRDGGYRHLPVVQDGTLVGVVSLRDFVGSELAEIEEETDFQIRIAEGSGRSR